jgi:hypothetical protein
MVYDGMTEFGQGRAATLLASRLAGDDWDAKTSVQAVYKQPSSPVRHPHLPAGFGNRAVLVDQFHQLDLARPNSATPLEIDAQCQPGHGLADGLASQSTGEIAIALLLRVHFGAAADG